MFSLAKIKQKVSRQKKRKINKVKTKKSEDYSYLSLAAASSPTTETESPAQETVQTSQCGSSWRYYNKLTEEVENICNNFETSFEVVGRTPKPKSLKLHKTLTAVRNDCKTKKRKMRSGMGRGDGTQDPDNVRTERKVVKKDNLLLAEDKEIVKVENETEFMCVSDSNVNETMDEEKIPSDIDDTGEISCLVKSSCEDLFSATKAASNGKPYLDIITVSEDALLMALSPISELCFCGSIWLQLLLGKVCVLGYDFKEGDSYPVFSPQSHSLLSIRVNNGTKNIKQLKQEVLDKLQIPYSWIQQLNVENNCPVTIVKLSRLENSATRLIDASKILSNHKVPASFDRLIKDVLDIYLIADKGKFNPVPMFKEPPDWMSYIATMLQELLKKEEHRIVVTGGKGVGKSTFLKYVINGFLRRVPGRPIACLDLDPGQPEFSLSSNISLTVISEPLLGPSYTHLHDMKFSSQTQCVLGDISVNNALHEYFSLIKKLYHIFKKCYSDIPLIVNTMGYTANTGFDIMIDVLRLIRPTHVITLENTKRKENFPTPLHSEMVNNTSRGILERKVGKSVSYELKNFTPFPHSTGSISNRELRDLRALSYLSNLWMDEELHLVDLNCKPTIKVPWNSIAIHVHGSFIPMQCILRTINASLVALCHVSEEYLENIGEEMPLQIQANRHWYSSSTCFGWGIVRGVDPVLRELHILTPISDAIMMLEVNLLIMTKTCLPNYIFKVFAPDGGPYMQKRNGRPAKGPSGCYLNNC